MAGQHTPTVGDADAPSFGDDGAEALLAGRRAAYAGVLAPADGRSWIMCRCGLLISVLVAAASAQTTTSSWAYEFDAAGALPSSDPTLTFSSTFGTPEPTAASVQGGVLGITMFGAQDTATWSASEFPIAGSTPVVLDPSAPTVMEVRMRISQAFPGAGTLGASAGFCVSDGVQAVCVFIAPAGNVVATTSATTLPLPIPFGTVYHVLRAELVPGQAVANVFIDGLLVGPVPTIVGSASSFSFGSQLSWGSDSEWDWVRVWNGPGVVGNPVSVAGTPSFGSSITLPFTSPTTPSLGYAVAVSGGTVPGIALPDGRVVPLAAGPLFFLSVTPGNGVFTNMSGMLDPAGVASPPPSVAIPNDPALVGATVYVAGVVTDALYASGIGQIGQAIPVTILP